jgi:hypothetical protein
MKVGVAIGVLMAAATLTACSTGPSGAPATTTTHPASQIPQGTKAAPGQIADSYSACTKVLNQFSASGMMGFSGTEGEWAPLGEVASRSSTLVLLGVESTPQGPEFGDCLVAGPKNVNPVSQEWSGITAAPPGAVADGRSGGNGGSSTSTEGGAGTGVTKVTLVLANGSEVAAVTADGTYAAVWPGDSRAIAALVETPTGWHRQKLGA